MQEIPPCFILDINSSTHASVQIYAFRLIRVIIWTHNPSNNPFSLFFWQNSVSSSFSVQHEQPLSWIERHQHVFSPFPNFIFIESQNYADRFTFKTSIDSYQKCEEHPARTLTIGVGSHHHLLLRCKITLNTATTDLTFPVVMRAVECAVKL